MPYQEGEKVRINSLGREGEVTRVHRNGRYRVALGSLTIEVVEDELSPSTTRGRRSQSAKNGDTISIQTVVEDTKKSCRALSELDLHGYRVLEALQLLDARIDKAVLAGLDEVRVIHGIGNGKIMDAVEQHLRTLSVVRSFKRDDFNPGLTRVFL